ISPRKLIQQIMCTVVHDEEKTLSNYRCVCLQNEWHKTKGDTNTLHATMRMTHSGGKGRGRHAIIMATQAVQACEQIKLTRHCRTVCVIRCKRHSTGSSGFGNVFAHRQRRSESSIDQ